MNPLLHFVLFGKDDGRKPLPTDYEIDDMNENDENHY
jgi:hypothetical protein